MFKVGARAIKVVDTFSEAFDYCRESNKPVRVCIREATGGTLWKLFPSGHATQETTGTTRTWNPAHV